MSLAQRASFLCVLFLGGLFASVRPLHTEAQPVYAGLVAHEWGTFTSIAGSDGEAMEWWPLKGATDLPDFVEHFRDAQFKFGLSGRVRMETPVLYFYSPREQTVSVSVRFSKGLITEWYPYASRIAPTGRIHDGSLIEAKEDGSIAWQTVTLKPGSNSDFPVENRASHYYAARQTTSTPLKVQTASGEQWEKFLFYRGVAIFPVPIRATVAAQSQNASASAINIENRSNEEISNTILFERRGEKVGYRIGGALNERAVLDAPELNGNMDDLGRELESILIAQGLYANEAQAMVQTWRDSWFEEGSRLPYIVPQKFLNSVLPLTINPAPVQTVRVFVGRLELVTPATERAIQQALNNHDKAALAKYDRFLEPILQTMLKFVRSSSEVRQLQSALSDAHMSHFYLNRGARKQVSVQ